MTLPHVPDLDSLALLLEVAEAGSLGRAAVQHGLSQPAASARVQGMERLVGFPLLSRGPRGSTLTAAGALLADWARDVLHAAEVLEGGIRSLREDREGRLLVAASLTVAEHLLPIWLARFAAERPGTAVRLAASNSADVAATLLRGTAEIGFVEGPGLPAGLQEREVARDRLVVVVPPGHPWTRRRRPVEADELAGTRLVQREPTSGTRASLEAALAGVGPMATPLLELSTTSAVRSAVAAGAGPAVLSDLAVRDDVAVGRLVVVPVHGLDLGRSLRAVWPTGQRLSGPAADLLRLTGRP
jgi:molybdate transport repressor ModE-like protein